ncbi:MAG: D-lyxose/D-mannose family sugar isomerase [Chloroflexota bacterium]|jgi:hypothetical protein|nr:D-lyxose/D-mannose family sugar isomerase [Chloroflexota bacterium]
MKRSKINSLLQSANEFIKSHGFHLPPFAYWTPEEWLKNGNDLNEIVKTRLGWDITDFGTETFDQYGLILFTLRNGSPENIINRSGKIYAEKIMVVDDGQITPMHFHWTKMEDIINRGGGTLAIQLFNATDEETLDKEHDVQVSINSIPQIIKPGEIVYLEPGESITLEPYCYHQFWGEGQVLVGEVSLVNDDQSDNLFLNEYDRFPKIVEDEPPKYLLCSDYRNIID